MQPSHLPNWDWDYLETVIDDLAETPDQKAAVIHLIALTREMSPFLTKLDLLREIICIGLVLLPENDRPPEANSIRSPNGASAGMSLSSS